MKTYSVTLPDDLAAFVESAVASGTWPTIERLFTYAITLARTEAMLGRSPAPDTTFKTKSGTIQAVDLTRRNFDSAAFVAGLVDKIHVKKMTQPPQGGS